MFWDIKKINFNWPQHKSNAHTVLNQAIVSNTLGVTRFWLWSFCVPQFLQKQLNIVKCFFGIFNALMVQWCQISWNSDIQSQLYVSKNAWSFLFLFHCAISVLQILKNILQGLLFVKTKLVSTVVHIETHNNIPYTRHHNPLLIWNHSWL